MAEQVGALDWPPEFHSLSHGRRRELTSLNACAPAHLSRFSKYIKNVKKLFVTMLKFIDTILISCCSKNLCVYVNFTVFLFVLDSDYAARLIRNS